MDNNFKKPTLYHGADLRFISLSKEERKKYKVECTHVANFLWAYLFDDIFDFEMKITSFKNSFLKATLTESGIPFLYENLNNVLSMFYSYLNNAPKYRYDEGVTFFCTDILGAKSYAMRSFAGGEMGLIAYRMIQGAKALKSDFYDEANNYTKELIDRIVNYAEKENPKPVVIPFNDYDLDLLQREDGRNIEGIDDCIFYEGCNGSVLYLKEITFNLDSMIKLYEED